MSDEYIILLSAILATVTLISLKAIVYIIKVIQFNKIAKNSKARMEELEKLEEEGKIKTIIIDLESEKYNDLTSWFIKKQEGLYIIGKQEDYIIKLLIDKN